MRAHLGLGCFMIEDEEASHMNLTRPRHTSTSHVHVTRHASSALSVKRAGERNGAGGSPLGASGGGPSGSSPSSPSKSGTFAEGIGVPKVFSQRTGGELFLVGGGDTVPKGFPRLFLVMNRVPSFFIPNRTGQHHNNLLFPRVCLTLLQNPLSHNDWLYTSRISMWPSA